MAGGAGRGGAGWQNACPSFLVYPCPIKHRHQSTHPPSYLTPTRPPTNHMAIHPLFNPQPPTPPPRSAAYATSGAESGGTLEPQALAEMRSRLVSGLKRYFHAKRMAGLLSVKVGSAGGAWLCV